MSKKNSKMQHEKQKKEKTTPMAQVTQVYM